MFKGLLQTRLEGCRHLGPLLSELGVRRLVPELGQDADPFARPAWALKTS